MEKRQIQTPNNIPLGAYILQLEARVNEAENRFLDVEHYFRGQMGLYPFVVMENYRKSRKIKKLFKVLKLMKQRERRMKDCIQSLETKIHYLKKHIERLKTPLKKKILAFFVGDHR